MDAHQVPEKYTAVVITKFGQPLEVQELPVPEVAENEVLIKVEAAPINPSDVGFIHGFYPAGKVVPVSPGLEGTGTVVRAGAQVPERYKAGTRVSFFSGATSGSYSQYAKAIWFTLLKLDDDVSFEDAASAFVNPVTVIGQYHTTKDAGVKAVVHNAAASALGRQFSKYFKDHGVAVINVVRRQEQVDLLKSEGAEIVLNETEEGFKDRLKELAHQHNATILFDPVAGEATATLLEQLPNGSTAYVYGGLGGRAVNNISVFSLIFQQKTIKGWWLSQYLKEHPVLQTEEFQTQLNGLLKGSLKTVYAKQYGLHEIKEALEYYSKNQTGGKVLVRPFKQ